MSETQLHTLNPDKWVDLHSDYLFNYTITRVDNEELAKEVAEAISKKLGPNFIIGWFGNQFG